MKNNEKILYRINKRGETGRWTIWSEDNTIYWKTEAAIGNSPQYYKEIIAEGKAGRSIRDQIILRINSRVRTKLDEGFITDKTKLTKELKNQLGFYRPALAVKYEDVKGLNVLDCYSQYKFNGHRCMMQRDGDNIIAYSRRGKYIDTLNHMTNELNLPKDVVLDGELYIHGQSLQSISSLVKRQQPDSVKLKFVVYDAILENDKDAPFYERYKLLMQFFRQSSSTVASPGIHRYSMLDGRIVLAGTKKITVEDEVDQRFQEAKEKGFEGLILRPEDSIYQIGRRTNSIIKVKSRFDDEFKVVDIEESRFGTAVLHLALKDGRTFKATAPGNQYEKDQALHQKEKYIGKRVTVEYAELTDDGVPFHCVATGWREDI